MPAICKLVCQQSAKRAAKAVPGAEDPPAAAARGQVVHHPQHLRVHAVIGIQEATMHLRGAKGALLAARQRHRKVRPLSILQQCLPSHTDQDGFLEEHDRTWRQCQAVSMCQLAHLRCEGLSATSMC